MEEKSRAHISLALARTPDPARVPRPEFPRERGSLRPARSQSAIFARDMRVAFLPEVAPRDRGIESAGAAER